MEKVINGVSCRVVEKEWDVYFDMALTMFEEIVKNNQAGKPSVFIVPVGPTDQYPILAKLINSQRVSLKNVHFFNMDEYLVSPTQWISEDDPMSFHGRIGCPFLTGIDGCFRSHKSNIRFPGDQRSQHFICSESSYQCKIQTFFFKISFFDCHILRRIENRMGYFIQCNFGKLLFCSIPLCSKYSRRQCCHSQDNSCRQ